jgi:hypothetical protein
MTPEPITVQITSDHADRVIGSDALLGWLRGKLADAEKELRSREDMANAKPLTDAEWGKFVTLPGTIVTKGRKLSKAKIKEMEEEPKRHARIAIKCSREVEMFRAAINALTPN